MFYMAGTPALSADRVCEIDPSTDPRWDKWVEAHPLGWLYHTSHWKEILEHSFSHIKACYLALEDRKTGRLKAGLPLCSVDSWLFGNRLVALPFASLFDPLVASKVEFQTLLNAAIERKFTPHYNYLEIRGRHGEILETDCRLRLTRDHLLHQIPLDRPPQELRRAFHRTCVRQRIARAQKCGIAVRAGTDCRDLTEFYRLYTMTRRHLCLPPQPFRFIRNLWHRLHPLGHAELLLATHRGRDVGGVLLLKYRDRVSVEYAVHDQRFLCYSPIHLLFWQAIRQAWNDGYRVLDFGRTAVANPSLATFKKRWGACEIPMTTACLGAAGLRTVGECCRRLPTIGTIQDRLPGRLYQLLGRFCYKHLG